jgi:mannose-1-phosphate guanylyltransferase
VVKFQEKPKKPMGNLANGAIYILSKEMIASLSINSKNIRDFSTEIISKYLGKIYTYETKQMLIDIGTPETYKIANNS